MMTLLAASGCGKSSPTAPAEPPKQHVFYVSPTGNDAAAGTLQAPMRGINAALAKAAPGDTVIVREGRYYEKVSFPKPGRLEKMITLKAYAGERPVIDGTGMSVSGKEALVTIHNASYVQVEGFDICNFKSSAPGVSVNGIVADAGSFNIVIRRNRIYNI